MDRVEFERQALEHCDAVYRMAFHLTGDAESAEELVQEVFVRALRPRSSEAFSPQGGGMRSWLFVICHNAYCTMVKKAVREQTHLSPPRETADTRPGPSDPSPVFGGPTMNWEQVDEKLKRAIDRLAPEFREVLLLWSVEGLKYREIADVLDVRLGTVMSRLYRARKAIADTLRDDDAARRQWRLDGLDDGPIPDRSGIASAG